MTNDTMIATITIPAPAETVFDILADPTTHPAIDGTGWVKEALDSEPVTAAGQIFRVAMYHDNHPLKNYEMANKGGRLRPSTRDCLATRAGRGRGREPVVRRLDLAL